MPRSRRTRLTDSPEFEKVYGRGAVYRGKLFSVHVYPNDFGNSRLGLSVSRKVGNAVTRNLVRRRLKEIFHVIEPGMSANVDIVVSARRASARAEYGDLAREFTKALHRLRVSPSEEAVR